MPTRTLPCRRPTHHRSDSELVRRLQPEIERFGRTLRWVHRLEPLFAFVPIAAVLRWWGFTTEFRNQMVFPLTALFFGTGNQVRLWGCCGWVALGGAAAAIPPLSSRATADLGRPMLPDCLLAADAACQRRRCGACVPGPSAEVGRAGWRLLPPRRL